MADMDCKEIWAIKYDQDNVATIENYCIAPDADPDRVHYLSKEDLMADRANWDINGLKGEDTIGIFQKVEAFTKKNKNWIWIVLVIAVVAAGGLTWYLVRRNKK